MHLTNNTTQIFIDDDDDDDDDDNGCNKQSCSNPAVSLWCARYENKMTQYQRMRHQSYTWTADESHRKGQG